MADYSFLRFREAAVVFYYENAALDGDPCFDVRGVHQMLPGGAIFAGLVWLGEDNQFHELVIPSMTTRSHLTAEKPLVREHLTQALAWARWLVSEPLFPIVRDEEGYEFSAWVYAEPGFVPGHRGPRKNAPAGVVP